MNDNWSVSIIMPHRPLTPGSLSAPNGPLIQEADGRWRLPSGEVKGDVREDIERGISFLNKNSYFSHRILVAIDSDVFPQERWLSEFPNVRVVRSTYVPPPGTQPNAYCRLAAAYRDAVATVPDEEWVCEGYTSDLICAKDWDWYIAEAIKEYGEENVYTSMFVETHQQAGTHLEYEIKGTKPTPHQIWIEFREKVTCHSLTWPEPNTSPTEDDFNEYIEIARRGHVELNIPEVIWENCGDRQIGYYNVMFMKAKYSRIAGFDVERGMGFDIGHDDALRDKARRMKGVVTDSYVYHPATEWFRLPFQWR